LNQGGSAVTYTGNCNSNFSQSDQPTNRIVTQFVLSLRLWSS
jgi:hypothetical protein